MMDTYAWAKLVFTINIVLMILANALWYWIKIINSSYGYNINFWRHFRDFRHLTRVIEGEEDPKKRRKYRAILWALRIAILVIVVLLVLGGILVSMSEAPLRVGR
ncbi:MAG: hypothetical protein ABFE01_20100 [Phycisphaerales bacterium]